MRGFLSSCALLVACGTGLLPRPAAAQTAIITSEFVRYRPDAAVVSSDKAPRYRELLSPAVARNAHFTFRVTVVFPKADHPEDRRPEGSPYTLHIAQNPEDSAQVRLYQEIYSEVEGEWIPDSLKPVDMPHGASLAEGQVAQSYLVDLFVRRDAEANHRFRIEVQLYRGDGWMILPMEIRVRQALVDQRIEVRGNMPALGGPLPQLIEPSFRAFVCGTNPPPVVPSADTGRYLLLRNLAEDFNLAQQRAKSDTRDGTVFILMKAAGIQDLPAFCGSKAVPSGGPEWWLRARDYLYQGLPVR